MVKRYDVENVRSPGGRYSHIGEIAPNARVFHLAGQTGTAPDGTIGDDHSWRKQREQEYMDLVKRLKADKNMIKTLPLSGKINLSMFDYFS